MEFEFNQNLIARIKRLRFLMDLERVAFYRLNYIQFKILVVTIVRKKHKVSNKTFFPFNFWTS